MAIEQLKIREIVKQAIGKNLDIPEFQREFVWDPEQVKLLAESLYRDYPVGSFLVWDSSEYQETKSAKGTQASLWIVDGQQRTTALCLLLGMKPFWWPVASEWNKALERFDVMVNLLPDGGDRLEFGLPNPIRRQDPRWISLRSVLSLENVEALTALAQETAGHLPPKPKEAMGLFSTIHARLQSLWQIRDREIPIVKIGHELEDVAEIFGRLNSAGTRVKEADVILALAAARNPGWIREDYLPFRNDLEHRGWDLGPGIVVRTIAALGQGRTRLKEVPRSFWDASSLEPHWKRSREVIAEVLKRLAEVGIPSSDLLPSTNSLVPLFVFQYRWGSASGYKFSRVLHWFLLANRDGRYSGSATTTLNEDVRAISNEAKTFEEALTKVMKVLRVSEKVMPDELLQHYKAPGAGFLLLALFMALFNNDAEDWVDRIKLGYDKTGSPITTGFQPEWHHIFPRKILKDAHVPEAEINALANITVLNERTNVKKLSAKEPARYIEEFKITPAELLDHYVPPGTFLEPQANRTFERLKKVWNIDSYPEFVQQRSKMLAMGINALMLGLES